jgi:hypothetical protein
MNILIPLKAQKCASEVNNRELCGLQNSSPWRRKKHFMVRSTLAFFFLGFPTFDIGNSRSSLTNKTSILPKFGIKGRHFGPEPVLPTKTGPRGLISSQQYSKLWCQVSSRFKTQ